MAGTSSPLNAVVQHLIDEHGEPAEAVSRLDATTARQVHEGLHVVGRSRFPHTHNDGGGLG